MCSHCNLHLLDYEGANEKILSFHKVRITIEPVFVNDLRGECVMELSDFLIVCPLVFLAGFIDAMGGGGGLISLPAYVLAGVPMHSAVATNKLSSCVGTVFSTARLCKHWKVDWKMALPAVIVTLVGSSAGARLSLRIDENILKNMMLIILPIVAFFVLRKNSLVAESEHHIERKKELAIAWTAAFFIGMYDGMYGPGTGTFLLIVFLGLAKMSAMDAAVNTKIINLTSNVASFVTFLLYGHVWVLLGLTASVFSIAGHYLGAGMVLKNGTKVIRPVIILVLILLFVKILTNM